MIQDIKTKNIKSRIRERIKDFTSKLMEHPEVEGIVYLGGLANTDYKDFIDEFSDIDLGIFINTEQNNLPTWLQPFSFYIPVVDENGNENIMEVNLHQQILSEERKCEWADTKREAYAYASEVIFDNIYWSPQKQLKKQTIYDDISSMFPNLSQQDKKIFKGLLCEYFVQNLDEIYEIPRDALEKKYKDIIDKIIYQDPQTKKLIADFVRAYKTNNKEGIEIALKALRKRQIEIIAKDDGKFDIKKIDTISKKNDELYK